MANVATPLARIIHDVISADGRGFRGAFGAVGPPSAGPQGEKGARRTAGPRRTVRTPQVRGAPYVLRSKWIGSSEWSRRELSGLDRFQVDVRSRRGRGADRNSLAWL